MNDTKLLSLLEDLCCANGTSGDEKDAAVIALKYISEYMNAEIDNMGNVVAHIDGKGKHYLLDAHIDRIGMVVTGITDDGFIKVGACGGVDLRTFDAAEVIINGTEKIYGVVSAIPPHLSKSEENKANDISDVIIDIGMDKETAEKYIVPSDRVVFKSDFKKLLSSKVCCTALDNRAGVACLILAVDMLKEKGVIPNLTVVFSVCEETCGTGAKTSSFTADADVAIAVDVSFATAPDVSKTEAGELSKGPMIGFSSTLDYSMSKKIVSVAETCGIPYQKEIMGSRTGTNADTIAVSGDGVKMALVSIPLRNMHTQSEIVDVEDIKNSAKLICEYIISEMEEC